MKRTPKLRKTKKKQNSLSEKELSILKLICKEKTGPEIAEKLKMGLSTVETYKTNLYKKTKAKTLIGLFKYAVKNGIETSPSSNL